jgi:hypothetical protein
MHRHLVSTTQGGRMELTHGRKRPVEKEQAEHVMDLLEEHVPLSLIMDLTAPAGPDSREILRAEGEPELHWWERS